jgi:hypothetical protein
MSSPLQRQAPRTRVKLRSSVDLFAATSVIQAETKPHRIRCVFQNALAHLLHSLQVEAKCSILAARSGSARETHRQLRRLPFLGEWREHYSSSIA